MRRSNHDAQALANRFQTFNEHLITFVEQCPPSSWRKVTQAEDWPINVTAHHVGVIHYPVLAWVQLMVEGKPTPTITMTDVDQMNLQNVTAHANCTPTEVIDILHSEGDKAFAYLNTLDDVDLKREAYLKIFDTTMSAGQLFQVVLIDEAEKHLVSMQETVQTTGSPMSAPMSAAAIKALLYRLNDEIMNERKLHVVDEIFTTDVIYHVGDEIFHGPAQVKASIADYQATVLDTHVTVNAMIAEGAIATSHWTVVGTYQGESTATRTQGQKMTWSGITLFRVRDGKICERLSYGNEPTPLVNPGSK